MKELETKDKRILLVSDTHFARRGRNRVQLFSEFIEERISNYDVIILNGDMIDFLNPLDFPKEYKFYKRAYKAIKKASVKIYYNVGKHDKAIWLFYPILSLLGFKIGYKLYLKEVDALVMHGHQFKTYEDCISYMENTNPSNFEYSNYILGHFHSPTSISFPHTHLYTIGFWSVAENSFTYMEINNGIINQSSYESL